MNVEELIDELYEMVEKAWNLPLSRGRAVLDGEEVKQILDEIRENLPRSCSKQRRLLRIATRSSARRRWRPKPDPQREERARAMVNQDEIVKQAQQKANDLLTQTQIKTREMRKAANEYVDDLMRRTDEALAANLAELRKTRQNIKATQRSGQN